MLVASTKKPLGMNPMKPSHPLLRSILIAALLCPGLASFAATEVTVNSTNNQNTADAELTLPEAILIQNGTLGRALTPAENLQVTTNAGTTNRINFNISGTGPHYIKSPYSDPGVTCLQSIEVSNLIIDGYSQPGSSPNTNPILAANNALIKIVLDCRDVVPALADARAVRISGNNVHVRGLCLLQTFDSDTNGVIYGIGFHGGAVGGSIQGCWLGVAPDQSMVAGGEIGIDIDDSGGGQIIGTDGNGVNDRAEFNVIVAHNVNVLVEGGSANCRVSGNFIGVMPDGLSIIPPAALEALGEGDAFEGDGADNLIFGTDANGIADAEERNIVGGIRQDDAAGRTEVFEFWGPSLNVKIMGNYFGVGVDGVTALTNKILLNAAAGTTAQIGSDGDGVRDDIEANIIANHFDYVFRFGGPTTALTFPRNAFFGNTGDFFNDPQNSFNGVILEILYGTNITDIALITPVISNATTRTELVGWVPVSGPGADNLTAAEIAIYLPDPATSVTHPQGKTWLASYRDNGPQDLDLATNTFRFNISSLALPATGASLVVSETAKDDFSAGTSTFSSAVSLPDVSGITLVISRSADAVTITWPGIGTLQAIPSLSLATWTNVPGSSPITLPIGPGSQFFRLAQ